MKKRLNNMLIAFLAIVIITPNASAQNTAPYWSLAGNSNGTVTTKLGTTNAVNLGIFTNNTERLRILSTNGNVGIGTSTPSERLRINGPIGINPMRVQVD